MATTSLMAIRGQLAHVVNYVRNPDKTANPLFEDLRAALHYAENDRKTEQRHFVSGINCEPDTAYQLMLDSFKMNDKPIRVVCYHGYQSFAEGEVDAATAHEIGMRLAQEMWGDKYVVLVATHLNTKHYHNHFVVCSTSFVDGRRFHNDHAARRRMAAISDRLCREYGLSVPESIYGHSNSKSYTERKAELEGKPTLASMMRADIDLAISQSIIMPQFFKAMEALGYELKHGKYFAIRYKGSERFRRVYKLGENYSEEAIFSRIRDNLHQAAPYSEKYNYLGTMRFRGTFKKYPRLSGLRALYYHYLYKMCILPQHKQSGRRPSPLLREDIIKLNKLIAQNDFLHKYKIDTIEQLNEHKNGLQNELALLDMARARLRGKLKHPLPDEMTERYRSEVTELTARMREIRREIKLCDAIEERSDLMREKLKAITEAEHQKMAQQKRKSRPRNADGR